MTKLIRKRKLAIDIIEEAKSYVILSNESPTLPIMVKDRDNLAIILEGLPASKVMATAGSDLKCIILIDYTFSQLQDIIDVKIAKRYANT